MHVLRSFLRWYSSSFGRVLPSAIRRRIWVWRFFLGCICTAIALHALLNYSPPALEDPSWSSATDDAVRLESLEGIVNWVSRGKTDIASRQLGSCAIVGSGDALVGARLGEQIDSHDTVVRVNRLPTEAFVADFGKRATILFSGKYLEKQPQVDLMGGGSLDCSLQDNPCGLEALIVKGPVSPEGRSGISCIVMKMMRMPEWPHLPACWYTFTSVWARAPLAVGSQLDSLGWTTVNFPVFERHRERSWLEYFLKGPTKSRTYASTGFFALLTFAPICDSMSLYGFRSKTPGRSDATSDGHRPTVNHGGFLFEHALLRRLVNGSVGKEDFPPNAVGTWLMGHFTKRPGYITLK